MALNTFEKTRFVEGNRVVEGEQTVEFARAVILNSEGQVLLLERSGDSQFDSNKFELPGGKLQEGEELREALTREVLEETGLEPTLMLEDEVVEHMDEREMKGGRYEGETAHTTTVMGMVNTSEVDLTREVKPEHRSALWANKDEINKMHELGELSLTTFQAVEELLLRKDEDRNSV